MSVFLLVTSVECIQNTARDPGCSHDYFVISDDLRPAFRSFLLTKQNIHDTRKMKFLATVLTALATVHAAYSNDTSPTRYLKRREVSSEQVATPKTMVQKTKPRQMLHSKHIPVESRIVGGNNAQQGDYPFFVQGDGCGGSLVWDDVVLTAAHCQRAFDSNVLVGPYIYGSTSGGAEYIDVQQQVPHPSYESKSNAYDFMLLKLKTSVTNPNLTPIAVNSLGSSPVDNEVLTVIGFGATSEDGSIFGSSQLQEVDVNYIDYSTCNNLYAGHHIIDSVMFCAGVSGGGKDSCQGDSGGPIFDQEGTQVGVVSLGIGCAREDFPGVYSRVSAAKDWIDATICKLSSSPPASCFYKVVIEVTYDNFPLETGWTLRDSAGTLIVGQSAGSFSTQGGTVLATVYVGVGGYTFEMTDDPFGDGICCEYGSGDFKITVNGEPVAIGGNGDFEYSIQETFDVGGLGPAVDFRLDVTYDEYPEETDWGLRSRTTDTVVAASGFREVTEEGFFLSQSVNLIPGDEYELVILDLHGDGMCCAYGKGSIALYATVDEVDVLITSSNGAFGLIQTNVFTVPHLGYH
jgi:trypsin